MPPIIQQEFSESETRALIATKMTEGDTFKIRIQRRRPGGGNDVIASFDEANADHIAYPEKWLPELAGGGNYLLAVYHHKEPMTQVGGSILFNVDNVAPRNVDIDAPLRPEWAGPRALTWPKRQRPGTTNGNGAHVDGREVGVDIATGPMTPIRRDQPYSSTDPHVVALERAQRAEDQVREERRRFEIETIRRASDDRIKGLETQVNRLMDELRQQREAAAHAKPQESMVDGLSKAMAPLVPLFQTMLQGNNDMKMKMMEMESQNAQRQLAMAQAQSEQLNKILAASMEKKDIDPAIKLLLETLSKKGEQDPVLKGVIESFSAMAQSTLQVMTAATDAGLIGNRDEGGTGRIIEEVARAAGGFFEMMANRPPAPAGGQTVTVPAGAVPAGQLPPAPAQRRPQLRGFALLDRLIKAHHNPTVTAKVFLDGLAQDRDLFTRFQAAGSDLEEFFKQNWGAWAMADIPSHGPYVTALNGAVVAEARKRGMLGDEAERKPATHVGPPAGTQPAARPRPRAVPPPPPIEVEAQAEPEPVAPSEEAGSPPNGELGDPPEDPDTATIDGDPDEDPESEELTQ